MADVRIIDNSTRQAGDELIACMDRATDVRIATAFAKKSGVARLLDSMERMLAAGGRLSVIYGLDFYITDAGAIAAFNQLADEYSTVTHFAYSEWALALSETFHPKVYICADELGNTQVIVGSSNLTKGGLWENIEANAVITGTAEDSAIRQAEGVFRRVITTDTRFVPDAEYVKRYEEIYRKAAKFRPSPSPPRELAGQYRDLKHIEEHSKAPRPTQKGTIIQAIKNLSENEGDWIHLREIESEAKRIGTQAGARFDWHTFSNSVRGRINEHTVGKDGRDLFERFGGVRGRKGLYRLADAGRRYSGR